MMGKSIRQIWVNKHCQAELVGSPTVLGSVLNVIKDIDITKRYCYYTASDGLFFFSFFFFFFKRIQLNRENECIMFPNFLLFDYDS